MEGNKNTQGKIHTTVYTNEKQERHSGPTQTQSRGNSGLPRKQSLVQPHRGREKKNIPTTPLRRHNTEEEAQEAKRRQREPYSMSELEEAIQLTKKGKAPGPDGIVTELIKWLGTKNRKLLLATINHWWETETSPEELYYAKVATIYKKGETSKVENYRPISLLGGFYKIYMILIRKRIQTDVEDIISKAQYGFRPAKSTAHAIHIIRRIQDYAEKLG